MLTQPALCFIQALVLNDQRYSLSSTVVQTATECVSVDRGAGSVTSHGPFLQVGPSGAAASYVWPHANATDVSSAWWPNSTAVSRSAALLQLNHQQLQPRRSPPHAQLWPRSGRAAAVAAALLTRPCDRRCIKLNSVEQLIIIPLHSLCKQYVTEIKSLQTKMDGILNTMRSLVQE